ncbi:hypothetical protein A1Q1_02473 [Trichosporon asahii var. asahii CBS 2479]|uniref:Uncharacterized protein n=1 Tax=Trichosporon asahii var. asahii (strain ATCC 90039 / CBS 2479 / JCM 2466 / KCTC 7840 / NBRC 103889/ NCYC 2677 / UAMH 7654) TaxID=1186058 RepID=J6EZZ7_TRIAS|nr:hypothetical protein A1Q1_02473 [Trichosporon asahii var. asahii CBS 2479]EJT48452.1 hypothetical protein A1Q1_02473 [Trichosporon asahii var. asahii CBS 2479]
MYDSGGWGTGGVTGVMTVSKGDKSCEGPNDSPTDGAFWQEPENVSDIKQCTEMAFGFTERVPLPAGVYGFIPSGDTFKIPILDPRASETVKWTNTVRAGSQVVFAVLDSGTYGDMGFLEPITVGESAQNGCLSGGSYGTTSASGPVQTGGGSSGELRGTGGNGNPPGGHGSGTGGGKGGQAGKSNTGTIVGAVVGSVVGAALILGVLIWWLLRRRRAVRTNYAVDLHDESDVPGTGTMTNAMITPLTFRHDSSQTTASMDEKGRLINGSLSSPASHSHSQNFSAPGSQGYTSQQLSGTHEGTASGSAGPSEFGSGPQNEPEIDAEAPFRQAGAQPPPSYDHVLWVTRPDGARRLRPRQNPDAPAGAPGAGAGGAAVVGEEKAPTTGLSLVQQ